VPDMLPPNRLSSSKDCDCGVMTSWGPISLSKREGYFEPGVETKESHKLSAGECSNFTLGVDMVVSE